MNRLTNKRILITGGTSGIGLAAARHALREGASVMVTGRRQHTLDQVAEESNGAILTVQSDISDINALSVVSERIAHHWGSLDAAFLCAADVTHMPLSRWQQQDYDRLMETNLKGPFFLLQTLVPLLENPSSVVLCGSVSAHIGFPDSSAYAASKAALLSLARTLSREFIEQGIRVNSVSPGPTETPAVEQLKAGNPNFMQHLTSIVPAGRIGTPAEIANAVIFLLSDESQYMRGSEIIVDGGVVGH